MTIDRDLKRAVRGWIAEGPERLPDAALDLALQQVAITRQRGVAPLAGRYPLLRSVVAATAAAAAVFVAALVAMSLLPGSNVGPSVPSTTPAATPTSTPPPSASPAPIPAEARVFGEFSGVFGSVVIDASRGGSNVSGSMHVTASAGGQYTVELRCSATQPDAVLLLGGLVTESTHLEVSVGDRVAVALRSGDPQASIFWFEGWRRPGKCAVFLEHVPDVAPFLEPIGGSFEITPLDEPR